MLLTLDRRVPAALPGMVALFQTVPEFQLGDVIEGRYQILRKLAEGGMGTVYLAEHVLIRRRVALKLLHADLASDSAMVRRFMNEASAAGTLGHPHIVESTDMGFTRNGIPYIVFEYLEGSLLIEEVYRLGGLPVRRALRIASQIASALDAAHNARIVHLDLKSDNVFLIDRGESVDHVKVLDFGISRFLEADLDGTQRGQLAGTPEFMAPEQVTMPDLVDGRADIYALGVLLYEMLSARCPHVNHDRRMLLQQIVHDPPAPLDRPVPAELEDLLFDRLLAKSRDERIQTMRDVKAALDELATSLRAGTSDSLFAFEEPSKEIDIAFFDGPLPGYDGEAVPVIAPAAVSAPVPVLAPATTRAPVTVHHGPRSWWIVAAMLAGATGGVSWFAEHEHAGSLQHAGRSVLESDASSIAAMLAMEARSARERVGSLASNPTLGAAIESRGAALADLVEEGQLLHPRSGELLELMRGDRRREVLLRAPQGAPPLAAAGGPALRIAVDGSRLLVIASEPVRTRRGKVAATLAIAAPIDLAPIERMVGRHAATAALVGFGRAVVLTRRAAAQGGSSEVIPIALDREIAIGELTVRPPTTQDASADTAAEEASLSPETPLSLVATTDPGPQAETMAELRRASGALGAALVAIYLLGWMLYGIRAAGSWVARGKA
jgi:tRNA A-37 threonylcarbamoyl transferase component Bud32